MKNYCAKCGKFFTDAPAISRIDNSPICPKCGLLEALDVYSAHLYSEILDSYRQSLPEDVEAQDKIVFECLDEFSLSEDDKDDIFADVFNYIFGFEDSQDDKQEIITFLLERSTNA